MDGTPDLYSFVLSGLRVIQEEYGTESDEAVEASELMTKFLNWVSPYYRVITKTQGASELYLNFVIE